MKKLLLLLATVATTGTGFAQAPTAAQNMPAQPGLQSPAQMAKLGTQYLTKELGLSASQQARLEPVLLAQHQALMAIRTKALTGRPQPGAGQELKATLAKYDTQIKGVLTPDQYGKYTKIQDAKRNQAMKQLSSQGMATPAAR